jgi:hypothetical protein
MRTRYRRRSRRSDHRHQLGEGVGDVGQLARHIGQLAAGHREVAALGIETQLWVFVTAALGALGNGSARRCALGALVVEPAFVIQGEKIWRQAASVAEQFDPHAAR